MRNKLDVLCIDGIVGVGKTTQVVVFRNLLKSHNIPHKIISFKEVDNTDFTKSQLLKISEYFKEEPDGIVVCDGSIAIDIVDDIVNNMHSDKLWKKHKDNIQIYESLNSQLNFVNILLTPLDPKICNNRLIKKSNMDGIEVVPQNNERLKLISKGLRDFDNNMLTYNIKFDNIDLQGSENIMDIHNEIKQIIKQKYQIKSPQ